MFVGTMVLCTIQANRYPDTLSVDYTSLTGAQRLFLLSQIQFTQDCPRETARWWERCPPSRMLNVLAQ